MLLAHTPVKTARTLTSLTTGNDVEAAEGAGIDSILHHDAYFHAPGCHNHQGFANNSQWAHGRSPLQSPWPSPPNRDVIFTPMDAKTYYDSQMSCLHPDCINEEEYVRHFGKQKPWRLTPSMMTAYVAMRKGTDGLLIGSDAPILPHLLGQEWNKAAGDP